MMGWVALVASLTLVAGGQAPEHSAGADASRAFAGTWSATGERRTLPTETGADAVSVHLSGQVVLATTEGLSRGFRAVMIGFEDGAAKGVGRCVWTDERGERIYSAIESEPMATGRRFAGRFTGGTGRYTGITGTYALTWQYVVRADDGTIQGRTADLKGQFRTAGPGKP